MAACEESDPRVAWMNERVTVGLKLKSDHFVKMCTSEADGRWPVVEQTKLVQLLLVRADGLEAPLLVRTQRVGRL